MRSAGNRRLSPFFAKNGGCPLFRRRRGVQSTLLHARLVAAADAGCDLAIVPTEPASTSQANVQRAGFALLYVRAILVRPASAA